MLQVYQNLGENGDRMFVAFEEISENINLILNENKKLMNQIAHFTKMKSENAHLLKENETLKSCLR